MSRDLHGNILTIRYSLNDYRLKMKFYMSDSTHFFRVLVHGLAWPALSLLLFAIPMQASAQDLVELWYLQPNLKSTPNEQNNNIRFTGLPLGKGLSDRLNLELNMFNMLSDSDEIPAARKKGLLLDGRYYLDSYGDFTPFVAGGVSMLKPQRIGPYEDPMTNIGVGFVQKVGRSGSRIQADLRYFMDEDFSLNTNPEHTNDWTLSLGVTIPLGGE